MYFAAWCSSLTSLSSVHFVSYALLKRFWLIAIRCHEWIPCHSGQLNTSAIDSCFWLNWYQASSTHMVTYIDSLWSLNNHNAVVCYIIADFFIVHICFTSKSSCCRLDALHSPVVDFVSSRFIRYHVVHPLYCMWSMVYTLYNCILQVVTHSVSPVCDMSLDTLLGSLTTLSVTLSSSICCFCFHWSYSMWWKILHHILVSYTWSEDFQH